MYGLTPLPSLSQQILRKRMEKLQGLRVLVLGDVILDRYIWGSVDRISPEAPVPVVEVNGETHVLGGAGDVVANVAALGGRAAICGVVGEDLAAENMESLFTKIGVDTLGLLNDSSRPTTIKTRIMAANQQIIRFDREKRDLLSQEIQERLLVYLKRNLPSFDALLISDYAKGVIAPSFVEEVLRLAQGKIICVDPKVKNIFLFHDVTVMTPNKKEALESCHRLGQEETDVILAGQELLEKTRSENIIITLGPDGMALFRRGEQWYHVPTFAREVYDVSGAGDTVISVLTLVLASGGSLEEGVLLANLAAGIAVGKRGTAPVLRDEMLKELKVEPLRQQITPPFSPWVTGV